MEVKDDFTFDKNSKKDEYGRKRIPHPGAVFFLILFFSRSLLLHHHVRQCFEQVWFNICSGASSDSTTLLYTIRYSEFWMSSLLIQYSQYYRKFWTLLLSHSRDRDSERQNISNNDRQNHETESLTQSLCHSVSAKDGIASDGDLNETQSRRRRSFVTDRHR